MNNIVLISIDNLRFDCIGYQPDKKELVKYDVLKYLETPTLDRIASRSLCFTNCVSTNTYTTSAHASMLTGLYPPHHGVRGFYDWKLSKDVFTLAEVLKMFGYETVMLTDTENLFVPLELHRGFDNVFVIDDAELLRFLEERKGRKLFVFAHLYDVHEPFLLSKNSRYISDEYIEAVKSLYEKYHLKMGNAGVKDFKRYRKLWLSLLDRIGPKGHETFFPLYVRGVSRFDGGRLKSFIGGLEGLGLLDDSLMVVVSDHGEGKSDEQNPDHFTHGVRLFDSVIRVPLMVYHRDFSHRAVSTMVSVVDIFPTIIDFALGDEGAGLLPYPLDGLSLKDLQEDGGRFVYSETWKRDDNKSFTAPPIFLSYLLDQRCVRTVGNKYVIYGEPEWLERQDSLRTMSDESFMQYIYRGVLRRFEGYDEYLANLRSLKTGVFTRDEFIETVLHSKEYRSSAPYAVYDLENDPYEEDPARFPAPPGHVPARFFDSSKDVSAGSVKAESIFPEDRETVIALMKNSGKEDWEEKAEIFADNKHLITCLIDDFLAQQNVNNIARNRGLVTKMVSSSKEFSLFLYDRISRKPLRPSFAKRAFKRLVPYRQQLRIYNFLSLKIFPERTMWGRMWRRVMSKIL
jgi:arylsulfatase